MTKEWQGNGRYTWLKVGPLDATVAQCFNADKKKFGERYVAEIYITCGRERVFRFPRLAYDGGVDEAKHKAEEKLKELLQTWKDQIPSTPMPTPGS